MLTNEQADQIGTGLIAVAESERIAKRNADARRIPYIYRFPEFESFELWERPIVLSEARRTAMKKPVLIAFYIFLSVLAICVVLYSVKFEPFGKLPPELYFFVAGIILSPAYLYRYLLIRRYVRTETVERKGYAGAGLAS
jgi:hypothetical protein